MEIRDRSFKKAGVGVATKLQGGASQVLTLQKKGRGSESEK